MLLAFYAVNNSQGYERDTFDSIFDKPEKIKRLLSKLNDDELRIYDTSTYKTLDDFVEDYNDEILDGGWWCVAIR